MRLRWVYTDQPFLPVGTGSVINNRKLNADEASNLTVGQLPVKESRFKQDARWRLPAGMRPGHMCHPEWFPTGEPFPPTLPPATYGPFWIPECCGLFQDVAEGGSETGGEAGDVLTFTDGAAGGGESGGEAGDVWGHADPAAGGSETGGEAGDVQQLHDGAAGGSESGGEAGDVQQLHDGAAGGSETGGEAGDVWGYADPTEGGSESGGEAGDVFTPSGLTDLFANGTFDITKPTHLSSGFFGPLVSQQFTFASGATILEIELYAEVANPPLNDSYWSIGTAPGAADVVVGSSTVIAAVYQGVGPNGYDAYKLTITISLAVPAGTYWLTADDSLDAFGYPLMWFEANAGTVDGFDNSIGTIAGGFVLVLRG